MHLKLAVCRKPATDGEPKKRRRKNKSTVEAQASAIADQSSSADENDDVAMNIDEVGQDVEKLTVSENPAAIEASQASSSTSVTTYDDGIFTVTISGPSSQNATTANSSAGGSGAAVVDYFVPCPRMNPLLAVRHGILYLYGGMYEIGDKQVTLSDFYSLDLRRMDEWKTIIPLDESIQVSRWSPLA